MATGLLGDAGFTPLFQGSTLFFRRGSEPARVGPCTMMLQYKQQQHNCSVARGNRTTATSDVTHTLPYINTNQYPLQSTTRGLFPGLKKDGT